MLEKETEEKRKKSKGKEQATGQPSEQAAGQPGEAARILNEIIREARNNGGEDLFPVASEVTDQLKKAFCGASFCLPKYKNERYVKLRCALTNLHVLLAYS